VVESAVGTRYRRPGRRVSAAREGGDVGRRLGG
jgi:hypothetical protein